MRKSILICFIVLLLSSCIHTEVFQHPDYNYAQTIPANVKIYTAELRPLHEYIIIGKMVMDPAPVVSSKAITEEMQVRAAFIGGDGVIITDRDVNIYAYNRGTVTQGALWGTRNYLQYNQRTRDTTMYVRRITLYGYVIKFKARQVTSSNRPVNKMWTAYKDGKIRLSEYTFVYIDTKTHLFHLFNCSERPRPGLGSIQLKYALEKGYKPCPRCIPFEHGERLNWTAYKGGKILLNEDYEVYVDVKTGIFHLQPDSNNKIEGAYIPVHLKVALNAGYTPCPDCIPIEHKKK